MIFLFNFPELLPYCTILFSVWFSRIIKLVCFWLGLLLVGKLNLWREKRRRVSWRASEELRIIKEYMNISAVFVFIGSKKTKVGNCFVCYYCGYLAFWKSTLINHIKIHTGERDHPCPLCDYKGIRRSDLTKHVKLHSGVKEFSCPFCPYRAVRRETLTRHVKSHTGEKNFSCSFCDYRAVRRSSLTHHMKVHTGEKNFLCSFCDYRAAQKSHLTRHLKKHSI